MERIKGFHLFLLFSFPVILIRPLSQSSRAMISGSPFRTEEGLLPPVRFLGPKNN